MKANIRSSSAISSYNIGCFLFCFNCCYPCKFRQINASSPLELRCPSIHHSTPAQSREHLHLSSSATSFITCMRKNQNHHSQQATPPRHANNFQSKKTDHTVVAFRPCCSRHFQPIRHHASQRRHSYVRIPSSINGAGEEAEEEGTRSTHSGSLLLLLPLDPGPRFRQPSASGRSAMTPGQDNPSRKFLSRPSHPMQSPEISHTDGPKLPVTNISAKNTTPVSSARSRRSRVLAISSAVTGCCDSPEASDGRS